VFSKCEKGKERKGKERNLHEKGQKTLKKDEHPPKDCIVARIKHEKKRHL